MTAAPLLGRPRPVRRAPLAGGFATVTGHHGEILQGIFEDVDGTTHRGLVTLRCPLAVSHATFQPEVLAGSHDAARVTVRPESKHKARRAAELALEHLGCARGGTLSIESTVAEGWGLGSSTSDVTAAILAVARALDTDISPADVATLAVQAERASDSLMFAGNAVLFAHREGRVLEHFENPLPPLMVLGLNPVPDAPGIDTLQFPPAAYLSSDLRVFEELRARLRRAIGEQDASRLGDVATMSAIINQRYLPVPHFDTLLRIARTTDAVGVQVAHSGRVVGVLFDAGRADCVEAMARAEHAVAAAIPGCLRWHFSTDRTGASLEPTYQESLIPVEDW